MEIGGPGTLNQSLLRSAGRGNCSAGLCCTGKCISRFYDFVQKWRNCKTFQCWQPRGFCRYESGAGKSQLQPVIDRVFEFEHAVEAWRYFESQQHTGKVVITMN
nr:zinc-binding dehydrogenase [Klebsiella pneumoniae subsp. pneumoniae]